MVTQDSIKEWPLEKSAPLAIYRQHYNYRANPEIKRYLLVTLKHNNNNIIIIVALYLKC